MWLNPQFLADLVTFTEDIHNEKIYVLWSMDVLNLLSISDVHGQNNILPGTGT